MDKNKQNIVKNIAEELDCGFDCYYNFKTTETITIPNFSKFGDEDDFKEFFQSDLEKIEKNHAHFIKFEALKSFESFKIMERFVEQLPDKNLQSDLENTLASKKPFQNFNSKIERSDFKQNWFDFKQNQLEKRVASELKRKKVN